jgi:hypothetical protein
MEAKSVAPNNHLVRFSVADTDEKNSCHTGKCNLPTDPLISNKLFSLLSGWQAF